MSSTIWINLRNGSTYESHEEDYSALFDCAEGLDALAATLKVQGLTAFYDDIDLRYNMDEAGEFGDGTDGWPVEAAQWFSAEVVLVSVSALRIYLDTHPKALKAVRGWTQDDVQAELASCQAVLEGAIATAKPVHLCIVM